MRKKPSILKDILFLSISSFIVIAAWIGFNIYHTHVTTTITPELQIRILPIQPEFDTATIENLKTRKQVVPVTALSNSVPQDPAIPAVVPAAEQTAPAVSVTPVPTVVLPDQDQTQPVQNDIPVTILGQ